MWLAFTLLMGGVDIFGVELPIARLPVAPPLLLPPPKRDLKFFEALPSLSMLKIRVIPVPEEIPPPVTPPTPPPPPPPLAPHAGAADVAPFVASSFSWTETKVH